MTRADDVIHALTGLHTDIAKRLDDAPTGVVPGYSAALGGNVMPNGKIRSVTAGTSTLVATLAFYSGSVPTINSGSVTAFAFDGASPLNWWAGAGTPTLITVPVTGIFFTIARPEWFVDNTTGGRYLEIAQFRGMGAIDGTSFKFPHGETSYNACPSLTWRWDVVAGDQFEFYNEHSGGVNTLKCDLSVWFQQIG